MTREEQIIAKASKDSEIYYKVNDNYGDCFHGGFIDGAKWADENPKQGLISIDKACEWLESAIRSYAGYYGTATRFLPSIKEKGILKMSRNYVQLSENFDIAMEVGKRHGKPVVLAVDTKTMCEDGIKFYLSNNNVWLTEFVDSKYILAILGDNKK